jgi:hypothetical protein
MYELAALLRRIVTGLLVGALFGIGGNTVPIAGPVIGSLWTSASASGCSSATSTEQDGYLALPTGNTDISGVQAGITVDTVDALRIDCSYNYYSVGIQAPSGSCGGTGSVGFSQVGWGVDSGGTAKMFTYQATLAGGVGCGHVDWPGVNPTGNNNIFKAVATTGCIQGGGYQWKYYLNRTLEDSQCSDWSSGNSVVEFGERYGTTNQMGEIGFWWIKYCTASLGCTPGSDPGTPPSPKRLSCGTLGDGTCGYSGRIGYHWVSSQSSWPNFYVCDISLSSSQC